MVDLSEIVFIAAIVGFMIGPWFLMDGTPKVYWLSTFSIIVGVIIIAEALAFYTHGRTISQMFWAFSLENHHKAWAIIGMLGLSFIILLCHLAAKMINR